MKISLVSNNSGTSKIHFVVVLVVDMAGDLGVMVEHSNNPFVFCNPGFQWSFSLTVVYKTAVTELHSKNSGKRAYRPSREIQSL